MLIDGNKTHKENLSSFEKVAIWVNNHLGTIEFTVFCFILVTIPLVAPKTQTVIFYISSGYLQLVLLPLIIMGGNIQSRHAEHIEKAHYKNMLEHEKKLEKILKTLQGKQK